MKKNLSEPKLYEIPLTVAEFLTSFNQNMPENFTQASLTSLLKFKKEHESLFRNGDSWSLDQHRKKVMDWLPQNINREDQPFTERDVHGPYRSTH